MIGSRYGQESVRANRGQHGESDRQTDRHTDSQPDRLHPLNSRHYNVNVKAGCAEDYISLQAHAAAAEPVREKCIYMSNGHGIGIGGDREELVVPLLVEHPAPKDTC